MPSNLDRYKKDLDSLIAKGDDLHLAIQAECYPKEVEALFKKGGGPKDMLRLKSIPPFAEGYQTWYSESKALIRQLLPDRLTDFVGHYEKPKTRKQITYENHRVADYLQGLTVTSGWQKEKVVGPDAAIPQFRQQLAMLNATKARFESSLFDIRQLVQADLFDSELDAANELAKKGFARAAGALAGVVLERHLRLVCDNHAVPIKKKPTMAVLNDALKENEVIDLPQWRSIQHLADIRNLCDHPDEPTAEQVKDLLAGVSKVTKTLF
jgi:hypothetical protein